MGLKKWFQKAVMAKPPYKLNWKKSSPVARRRASALASRPKNWGAKKRYLSTARALQALANVTKDSKTKELAKADAEYFYRKARA